MDVKFYRKVLKNGMTILFEKREIPVISVAFALRGGSLNELESEKGISHFIEHMLYKGTSTRTAKQIAEEIEKKGGELNGGTAENMTYFWCKIPSRHLNIALKVLSDIIRNSLFDENKINKERKVIFEEIKLYKDNPLRHVFNEIHNCLYKKPFGMPALGTVESLKFIDKKKLVKRFEELYQPNNLILSVVGKANFNEIIDFTEKNFFNKKGKKIKIKIKPQLINRIEKRKGLDQVNLVIGYHVPPSNNKKTFAAQILSVLMAGGMSSRLWNEIREKRNLAYIVKGASQISREFAYNVIYVGTTKENLEKVKKIILDEFKKVAEILDEKELREIKEQVIGNYHISMEDSQVQMENLLLHELDGNAKKFYEFEKNILAVKLKDVKEIAKKVSKNHCFFELIPE